jgi:AraC-like DNA-binding protein
LRQSDPEFAEHPARGLLHKRRSFEHFELTLIEPSAALARHVEHHWLILWDLTGKPAYEQQNLSHPSQHLVINPQADTGIFGAATGVFNYRLEGSGRVFGTKFRPGAFHGFFGRAVSALTDSFAPVELAFPRSSAELEAEFTGLNDPSAMGERIEALLLVRLPELDGKAILARDLVERIQRDRDLHSVAVLAEAAGMTVRSLQRLFDRYVGVTPKWVIDRYRMIEAVETMNAGAPVSLTALAQELGYFDQAHFTKAFQQLTGWAPSAYKAGS